MVWFEESAISAWNRTRPSEAVTTIGRERDEEVSALVVKTWGLEFIIDSWLKFKAESESESESMKAIA